MIDRLRDYAAYLVIGSGLFVFDRILRADYLEDFLLSNQLIILITIFAISSATNSIILTKLKDLSIRYETEDFEDVLTEVSVSFSEQIIFILATVVLSIALSAKVEPFDYFKDIVLIALVTVFIAAIDNLWDSTKASFILLGFRK